MSMMHLSARAAQIDEWFLWFERSFNIVDSGYMNISKIALAVLVSFSFGTSVTAQKQKMQAVDLGLSVKWANMNVGAASPIGYGAYYAWGEIAEKRFHYFLVESTHIEIEVTGGGELDNSTFSFNILKYSPEDGFTQLELVDDVANQKCGEDWRMPTQAEMQELMEKCEWTPVVQSGVKGFLVKSRVNSNSIFLPNTGYKTGHETKVTERQNCSTHGYYWTSTLADSKDKMNATALMIMKTERKGDSGSFVMLPLHRTNGCVVRPVSK